MSTSSIFAYQVSQHALYLPRHGCQAEREILQSEGANVTSPVQG